MTSGAQNWLGDWGEAMPVLFVGHGSPTNAIEDNPFSRTWRELGKSLPRPKAILCISAHWETRGTAVTAMERPQTIHDFGGFARALYEAQYPAPGSPWLAAETRKAVTKANVALNQDWGLDHGCWSVLIHMVPQADIPVVQLSLDHTRSAQEHYDLAKGLAPLRREGVLIVGSGNMVHNLRRIAWPGDGPATMNDPYGFDWALEASHLLKTLINERRHAELADYRSLGPAVQMAIPTPEHYLPLLYALALQQPDELLTYFNDQAVLGSLTMTSLVIGPGA
jgi:4,5-DOPA dioxygenase extradiol